MPTPYPEEYLLTGKSEETRRLTFNLPIDLDEWLKEAAQRERRSVEMYIRVLIEERRETERALGATPSTAQEADKGPSLPNGITQEEADNWQKQLMGLFSAACHKKNALPGEGWDQLKIAIREHISQESEDFDRPPSPDDVDWCKAIVIGTERITVEGANRIHSRFPNKTPLITAICLWSGASANQLKDYALNLKQQANAHLPTLIVDKDLGRK